MSTGTHEPKRHRDSRGWAEAPGLWLGAILFVAALSGAGCAAPQQRVEAVRPTLEPTLCSLGVAPPGGAGAPAARRSVEGASHEQRVAWHYASFGPALDIDGLAE